MKQFLSLLACGAMLAGFAATSHAQANIDQIKMSTGNGNALTLLTSGVAAPETVTLPDPGGPANVILSTTLGGSQTINGTVNFPGTVNFTSTPALPLAANQIFIGNGASPSVAAASGTLLTVDHTNGSVGISPVANTVYTYPTGSVADAEGTSLRIKLAGGPSTWGGFVAVGGTSATAVMGELDNLATIGAHDPTLSTWTNLYVNPGGGSVRIGSTTAPANTLDITGTLGTSGNATIGGADATGPELSVSPSAQASWNEGIAINPATDHIDGVYFRNTAGSITSSWLVGTNTTSNDLFAALNGLSGMSGTGAANQPFEITSNGTAHFGSNVAANGTLSASSVSTTGAITAGNGFTVSAGTVSLPANSVANAALQGNGQITVTGGTGLGVSGSPVALGGTLTLSNTGVTSLAGTANELTASASTGAVTLSLPTTLVAPGTFEATTSVKDDGLLTAGIVTNAAGGLLGTVAQVPIANGGTGQTTKQAAFDALSPTGTVGDIIYNNGTNNVALAGNTSATHEFLTSYGNGTNNTNTQWGALAAGDIPSGSGNYIQNQSATTQTANLKISGTMTSYGAVDIGDAISSPNSNQFGTDADANQYGLNNTVGITVGNLFGDNANTGTVNNDFGVQIASAGTVTNNIGNESGGGTMTTNIATVGAATLHIGNSSAPVDVTGTNWSVTSGGAGSFASMALTTALPITSGGTNSGTALSGNSIMVSNGTAIVQGPINAGTKEFLTQTSSGAPTWGTIAAGDVPAGSANYIQNTSTQQASSNFNISGNGTIGATATIGGLISAGNAAGLTNTIGNNGGNAGLATTDIGQATGAGGGTAVNIGGGTGTGTTTVTIGGGTATSVVKLGALTSNGVVQTSGGNGTLGVAAVDLTSEVGTSILPLANGGTGANLTASNGAVVYSGASAMALSVVGASGDLLTSGGTGAPTWTAPSGITAGNATNAVNVGTTNTTTGAGPYYPTFVTASTGNNPINVDASGLTFAPATGTLTATAFSGPLTGNVTGNVSGTAANVTGIVALANGGTNANLTLTTGDLIDAASSSAFGNIADVAAGSVLVSGGTSLAPSYSSTPTVSSATLTATTNQLTLGASAHNVVISSTAPAAATQTYTIPDAGGAASFVLSTAGSTSGQTITDNATGGTSSTAVTIQASHGTTTSTALSLAASGGTTNNALDITGGNLNTAGHITTSSTATYSSKTGDVTGTPTVTGSDIAGQVSFGYTSTGIGGSVVVTFANTYGTAPYIVVTPTANPLPTFTGYYVTPAAGGFTITFDDTGTASGTMVFDYIVVH